MKYYDVDYSIRGYMPNGKWEVFVSDTEYREAYEDYLKEHKR